MINNLYIVDYPRKTEFAEAGLIRVDYDYDTFVSCPECGSRVSGAYWKKPREVVLTKHKTPDFLYNYCDNAPFLISENAWEKIQNSGLVGITKAEKIENVRFQRKSKYELKIPTYFHIELARSRIRIDHQRSVIHYGNSSKKNTCPLCRQMPATYDFFRSLSFHMDVYEGFDIFHIYELCDTVFLSQKFIDFCLENQLTNLCYSPAEKYGRWMAEYFLDGKTGDGLREP